MQPPRTAAQTPPRPAVSAKPACFGGLLPGMTREQTALQVRHWLAGAIGDRREWYMLWLDALSACVQDDD
jgi:hypothetical protein